MNVSIRGWWARAAIGLLVLFVVIQLVPYGGGRLNPGVAAEPAWNSPATRALAKRACFDCHSNETEWPAYSRIAPVSWLIQHDVAEGRAAMNFSEWQRPQEEAGEAPEEVIEREMPPALYQLMHGHARLSDDDRAALARGLASTIGQVPGDDDDDDEH